MLGALVGPPVAHDRAELERALRSFARGAAQRVRAAGPFLKVFLSALPYLSLPARRQGLALLPTGAGDVLEGFLREGMRRGPLLFLITQEVLLGRRLIARDCDAIVDEAVRVFLDGVAVDRPARARSTQGGRS
ncbi:MAG TPA: hypothetical protein VNN19_11070 [bacterium]|nr:hypothetical protein [bacterium]